MGPQTPPTKAQQARHDKLREAGCICCPGWREPEIHHLIDGGKRMGHDFVLPICSWHHKGVPPDGHTVHTAESLLGPSLARNKRAFDRRFGTERELHEGLSKRV